MYRAVASGGAEPNSPVILRLFLPYDFVNDYVKLGIAMINMRKENEKEKHKNEKRKGIGRYCVVQFSTGSYQGPVLKFYFSTRKKDRY
jgi:hypothetical protein